MAAGYKTTSRSVAYARAARLVRNGKVCARLKERQSKEERISVSTMQRPMDGLCELRELAKANSQLSAKEKLRGKPRGFYVDQTTSRERVLSDARR
jgi:hypothetical protein